MLVLIRFLKCHKCYVTHEYGIFFGNRDKTSSSLSISTPKLSKFLKMNSLQSTSNPGNNSNVVGFCLFPFAMWGLGCGNLFLSQNTLFQFETVFGHLVVLNPILLNISTASLQQFLAKLCVWTPNILVQYWKHIRCIVLCCANWKYVG